MKSALQKDNFTIAFETCRSARQFKLSHLMPYFDLPCILIILLVAIWNLDSISFKYSPWYLHNNQLLWNIYSLFIAIWHINTCIICILFKIWSFFQKRIFIYFKVGTFEHLNFFMLSFSGHSTASKHVKMKHWPQIYWLFIMNQIPNESAQEMWV